MGPYGDSVSSGLTLLCLNMHNSYSAGKVADIIVCGCILRFRKLSMDSNLITKENITKEDCAIYSLIIC